MWKSWCRILICPSVRGRVVQCYACYAGIYRKRDRHLNRNRSRTLELADEGLSLYLTYQMADHPPRVSNIIIDVELPDDFPEDRKPALERILRLCPVYSTLMNPPEIDLDFG